MSDPTRAADAQDLRDAAKAVRLARWLIPQWQEQADRLEALADRWPVIEAVLDAAQKWADDWDDDQWCEEIGDEDSRLLAAVRAYRGARGD